MKAELEAPARYRDMGICYTGGTTIHQCRKTVLSSMGVLSCDLLAELCV